ncbi:hypothetical protein ACS0TY_030744 [Phlomoides rotata]
MGMGVEMELSSVSSLNFHQARLDEWKWTSGKQHRYSTSTSYWKLEAQEEDTPLEGSKHRVFDLVWKSFALRKAVTTLWRLLHNRLPTKSNILRRNIISPADSLCPLCSEKEETYTHLFLHCHAATLSDLAFHLQLDRNTHGSPPRVDRPLQPARFPTPERP